VIGVRPNQVPPGRTGKLPEPCCQVAQGLHGLVNWSVSVSSLSLCIPGLRLRMRPACNSRGAANTAADAVGPNCNLYHSMLQLIQYKSGMHAWFMLLFVCNPRMRTQGSRWLDAGRLQQQALLNQ
jgi:hypothetical protein